MRHKVERDRLEFVGEVVEAHRGGLFKVRTNVGTLAETIILATPCGKISQNLIKILVGDLVKVEVSQYDTSRGRIISRLR
jgi:translation initiation factor IF-1